MCDTEGLNKFRKMVTFGPSITAGGWSTSRERCWASLLAQMINDYQEQPVELFNAGLGANVISDESRAYAEASHPSGIGRLQKYVIDQKPDLVIIGEFAVNDARGGTPLPVYEKALRSMIYRIREYLDTVLVLTGPTLILDFDLGGETWSHANPEIMCMFNTAIARVAGEEDCLFVDLLAAMNGAEWLVHYDGVHVNDLGHRVIANEIFKVLAQNCSCLARRTKAMEQTSPRWRDESCLIWDFDTQANNQWKKEKSNERYS